MLPEALVSTYGQYKRDTAAVTTWLTTTATALGFQLSGSDNPASTSATAATTGRLKGRARVEARKQKAAAASSTSSHTTTHVVSLCDLIPMARLIAETKTTVPAHINTVLNAAIARRAAFAPKLAQHGQVPEPSSDTSHQHFVSVLEQVRHHLRPHMHLTTPSTDTASDTSHPTLANRFHGLAVSEPSQQFLDAPDVVVTNPFDLGLSPPPAPKARPTLAEILKNQSDGAPKSLPEMMSELLEADEFADFDLELDFAFSCLMSDLSTLRDRVRWIWECVKNSGSDFMEAAVTTDTAIELARSLIDEVVPLLEKQGHFGAWIQTYYIEQCVARGINMGHIIHDDIMAPVHPLVFDEATYQVADQTFFNAWQLSSISVHVPTARKEISQELHDKFDLGCDYRGMSFSDKLEHNESLFRTLLADLSTILNVLPGFPVHDALMSTLESIGKARNPLFHVAFAIQIYLDIAHTMGSDLCKGYDALMKQANDIEEDIQAHLAFHELHNMDPPTVDIRENFCWILENIESLRTDPVGSVTRATKEKSGLPLSRAEIRGNRLLRGSPLLSGLILFVLRARYRQLSLAVATAHSSISCGQHLYHALSLHQQAQRLSWPDMELIRNILPPDSFYPGGALPKTLEQCFRLASLHLGMSPTSFSRGRRPTTSAANKYAPRYLKPNMTVLSLFEKRYAHSQKPEMMTPEHLGRIVDQSRYMHVGTEDKHDGNIEAMKWIMQPIVDEEMLCEKARQTVYFGDNDGARKLKLSTNKHSVPAGPYCAAFPTGDAPDLILSLMTSIQAEAPEYNFPLLRMHRQCCEFLRLAQNSCDIILGDLFPGEYGDLASGEGKKMKSKRGQNGAKAEKNDGSSAAMFILMAATTYHKFGVPVLQPLDMAGDAMQSWLRSGGGREIRERKMNQNDVARLVSLRTPGWSEMAAPQQAENDCAQNVGPAIV
ncbi:DUF6604 domain-containing protein [Microdochium nivale]|nr:DUF6604 domain-containing protein [Microdochium nivale]